MQPKTRGAAPRQGADHRLWLVEVEEQQAHIYEKTRAGTQWIGDIRMEHDHLSLEIPDMKAREKMPAAPASRRLPFMVSFVKWLSTAEKRCVFDKAILMAEAGRIIDLQEALEKRAPRCIKLATNETLAKNEKEDNLAECMWL